MGALLLSGGAAVGAGFGILAAPVLRDRNRFVRFGVAGTALSLLPAVVMPDAVTTTLTLAALHVVAALGVVPAIASRLPRGGG